MKGGIEMIILRKLFFVLTKRSRVKEKPETAFNYIVTLKLGEADRYIKLANAVTREVECAHRGIHGGGCPYPIKIGFWDRVFSLL